MIEAFERHLKNTVAEFELGEEPSPSLIEKCKRYLEREGYLVEKPILKPPKSDNIFRSGSLPYSKLVPVTVESSLNFFEQDQPNYGDYLIRSMVDSLVGEIGKKITDLANCTVSYSPEMMDKKIQLKLFVVPAKDVMSNFRSDWDAIYGKS